VDPTIFDYAVVLPHPTEPRLLLLRAESGWALPHWQTTTFHYWQTCAHINRTVKARLGLEVTTLRCLLTEPIPHTRHTERLHELENLTPDWKLPAGAQWMGREALQWLEFASPAQRACLATWFDEQEQGIPPQRPAWARRGWVAQAIAWLRQALNRERLALTGPVEQLRTWERSCLLRAETSGGLVYLKAIPSMFAHEGPLTAALTQWEPDRSPQVLAYDQERRWLLLRDFGGPLLSDLHDLACGEEAMRALARLQIALVERHADLLALGCPDRSLAQLAQDIPALLADRPALSLQGAGLSDAEIAGLRSNESRYLALCAKLSELGLPDSLDHGDFGFSNVALTARGALFFDWSDSSLTHPFFSPCFFPGEIEAAYPALPNARLRLSDAYLEPWTAFASRKRLSAAFGLAQTLAPLHLAILHQRFILPRMEATWQMERMIPAYLRCLNPDHCS
jgi:hypothetical protein